MKKIRESGCSCGFVIRSHTLQKWWKMTRLMALLFILGIGQALALDSYAQATRLSLNFSNTAIEDVLEKIEDQSEFFFLYNKDLIDVEQKVDVAVQNKKINEILDGLFENKDIRYVVFDRQIVLSNQMGETGISGEKVLAVQQRTVSGTVTDESGEPLPGVTVVVKGTTQGTVTNSDGEYSLANTPEDATLVFSFVGMRTQEIETQNQTTIDVTMVVDAIGIEEVVAVGYGTQKKVNLTGAVGVANSERLENRTITSLGQGLQGVIPGLNITYDSGDPNEAADFNIRGYESINGGSPLILVDGVPMDVEKVNPNDIKSISVLKDASSSAIYGARAAFGVILVETKKGQIGKININFSAQTTLQKAIYHNYEPLKDNGTARQVYSEAFKLTRGRDLFPIPVIEAALAYQEMTNPTEDDAWFYYNEQIWSMKNTYMKDLAMRDFAPQQQYDFSISGASEKASYYVSFGMIDKEGFFRYGNENYKRYNALSKVEFKVNNWLTLEEKISFSSVLNDIPHKYGDQAFYDLIGRPFYNPNFFPDLAFYKEPGDHDQYAHLIGMYSYRNPIAYMKYGGRDTRTDNDLWLTQAVTITPLDGLKINGDFSYRYFWRDAEYVASQIDVLRGFNAVSYTHLTLPTN